VNIHKRLHGIRSVGLCIMRVRIYVRIDMPVCVRMMRMRREGRAWVDRDRRDDVGRSGSEGERSREREGGIGENGRSGRGERGRESERGLGGRGRCGSDERIVGIGCALEGERVVARTASRCVVFRCTLQL
jgi:hypothetical protein